MQLDTDKTINAIIEDVYRKFMLMAFTDKQDREKFSYICDLCDKYDLDVRNFLYAIAELSKHYNVGGDT